MEMSWKKIVHSLNFLELLCKPPIHYALNRSQQWTTVNDFQQAADFLSPTVADYRQFSANICIIFGHRKVMENHC